MDLGIMLQLARLVFLGKYLNEILGALLQTYGIRNSGCEAEQSVF